MASPALRLLASGRDDPGQALAVFMKSGRTPRVFAARERHKLVQAVQAAALARLGISLAGVWTDWDGVPWAACMREGRSTATVVKRHLKKTGQETFSANVFITVFSHSGLA